MRRWRGLGGVFASCGIAIAVLGGFTGPAHAQAVAEPAAAQATNVEPTKSGPEMAPGGRYGQVRVSRPVGALRGFVVLFSDRTGWQDSDQLAADDLARHGMLVVGVDTARYVATLAGITETCHHLVGDVEGVSHQFERELRSDAYFTPIVAGVGEGGILAEHMLSVAAATPSPARSRSMQARAIRRRRWTRGSAPVRSIPPSCMRPVYPASGESARRPRCPQRRRTRSRRCNRSARASRCIISCPTHRKAT